MTAAELAERLERGDKIALRVVITALRRLVRLEAAVGDFTKSGCVIPSSCREPYRCAVCRLRAALEEA